MTREAIKAAAEKMETTRDLLNLLNKIKMDDLGDKGHPFIMPHLNYFIHPSRNKANYKTFRIPKKSGGFREISAPRKLLKSFLTYANILLQSFYEAPDHVTGFVPGKSVVDNAERHVGMNYVFNTDLKDFFPSIVKSRVWATLKCSPFNFNDTIADAIAGLCCTEVEIEGKKCWVLPQGSPASPILTNIVCRNLDFRLHKLAREYSLRYSRYADDITFSGNRNVFQKDGEFQTQLEQIIRKEHFTINQKKTRLQKKNERQEVTGLIVSDRVNVLRKYVREIDNILFIWERYGEADAYAKFLVHYTPKQNIHKRSKPNMQAVLQGKLLYLKMVKGEDSEVWRRLQRRFNKLSGTNLSDVDATVKYMYTVSDFESKIGRVLEFSENKDGRIVCSFILNEKKTPVMLSRYARTRVTNIIAKGDDTAMAKFKSSYLILFYDGPKYGFWRIERKRAWDKAASEEMIDTNTILETILEEVSNHSGLSDSSMTTGKTTDEVLTSLVESGFDLNILDEWDKIKCS